MKEKNNSQKNSNDLLDTAVLEKNPEVTVREEMEEDGKYILFNAENEIILVTNYTGKYILENFDGSKTIGEIVDSVKNHFTIEDNYDVSKLVKQFVSTLINVNLAREIGIGK